MIANLFISYLQSHQQLIGGLLMGAIISHPASLAVLCFNAFVRIPGVGAYIAKNPNKAKAWADQFDQAIDGCVDKYAKDAAPIDAPPAPK